MNTHINGISKKGKVLIYGYMLLTILISIFPIAWIFFIIIKSRSYEKSRY
ncbi:sugar ABC transporter permease [Streptococcus pneumoniae]|nr:sugar ABC transporter permease [Streptococcus pneumoniae]VNM41921.1 sugar ABC transporter permease [Streptococcus pneumoniae]VQU86511.1 sugar ABC transporter permease [Streptococcus pneumoniae]